MKTATQEISRRILALVATGVDVIDAMKTVCGTDATESMLSELYNSLRTQ